MQDAAPEARQKRPRWTRFERDDQGRIVARIRAVNLFVTTAIASVTLAGTIIGGASVLLKPYLASVSKGAIQPEIHRLEGAISTVQRGLDERITRREYEAQQDEILQRLEVIAGEIRRVDNSIQKQSDRTDNLYSSIMRTLRDR